MVKISWDNIANIYQKVSIDIPKHGIKKMDVHGFEYFEIDFGGEAVWAYLDKNTSKWIGFNLDSPKGSECDTQEIIRIYLSEDVDLEYLNTFDVELAIQMNQKWILNKLIRKTTTAKIPANIKNEVKLFMQAFKL